MMNERVAELVGGKKKIHPYPLSNIPPSFVEGSANLNRYVKAKRQGVKILPFSAPGEHQGRKERETKTKEEEEI